MPLRRCHRRCEKKGKTRDTFWISFCVERDFNKVFDLNKTKPGEFHVFELELQSKVHV